MAEILTSITELSIQAIVQRDRLRPVSEAGVAAIVASIEELGVIKDPIHVRKVKHRGGEYVLLAGAHRLAAARHLEWETIKVTCWACNDDFAHLMEIDDNLAGAELTALDTAVFLAARKRLYEKMHPETKAGVAGGLARQGSANDIVSFAEATAEKFGVSKRHVERLVAAGRNLGPDEVRRLRSAPKPVTLKDIMEIGKVGNPAERYHVVDRLSDGTAKNASAARKLWKAQQGHSYAPASPVDTAFSKLIDIWDRAPKEVRLRFLEERGDTIDTLLNDLGRTGDRND